MRRRVLKVFLVMVLGAICSLAVVGMIAFLLVACGVHIGWLLALLSLPPGIALGVFIACGSAFLTCILPYMRPEIVTRTVTNDWDPVSSQTQTGTLYSFPSYPCSINNL